MSRPRPARPRVPDWPERLAALVEARRETPFAWGSHDCCLWAADAVRAMTGVDPAAAVRGRYASEEQAAALLAEAGGLEALAEAAAAAAGLVEVPPAFAQRGDVVLVCPGNEPALGVLLGERVALAGFDGLLLPDVATARVRRAWAV